MSYYGVQQNYSHSTSRSLTTRRQFSYRGQQGRYSVRQWGRGPPMVACYFAKFKDWRQDYGSERGSSGQRRGGGGMIETRSRSDEREVTMFWKFVGIRMFISLFSPGKRRCEIKYKTQNYQIGQKGHPLKTKMILSKVLLLRWTNMLHKQTAIRNQVKRPELANQKKRKSRQSWYYRRCCYRDEPTTFCSPFL